MCKRSRQKDKKVNIGFSSEISRSDRNLVQEIGDLNLKLKRYCEDNNFLSVDNVNVEESCLNNSKLHLNYKGNKYFMLKHQKLFLTLLDFNEQP